MTTGTNYRWVAVIAAALMAGLIAAVVTPRVADDGAVNWLVAVGAAAVGGALAALLTREKAPEDGAHIRDDALGPDR